MKLMSSWVGYPAVLLLTLLVSACDRNSSRSDELIPPVAATPPPSTTTITVVPSLGLISGAAVSVSNIVGAAIEGAAGTTDATGQVQLTVPDAETGPFIVTVSGVEGAMYFDEALNGLVSFAAGSQLRAIIPSIQAIVAVTPLTEIAAARFAAIGGSTVDDVNAVNEAVRAAFLPGIGDITAAPTVISAGSDLLGTSEADLYATYLAALANLAENNAAPALAVMLQLSQDFADGLFDNAVDGTPIDAPIFDKQSAEFNNKLNAALLSAITRFAQNTVSLSSFASALGSGFTVVDPGSNSPGDNTDNTDNTDDGTPTPPANLSDGAAKAAGFAGSYTFLINDITDTSGQSAPNSNQIPGSTIEFVISESGVVSFPALGGNQQVDFNSEDNIFQEVEESPLAAGFYRTTTPVADTRQSVLLFFRGDSLTAVQYQNYLPAADGSSALSEIIAIPQPTTAATQFFSDLAAIGSRTLLLVDKSDEVSFTPYLCDQRIYSFEVPSEIIVRDRASRIDRSLPPIRITENITSLANTRTPFSVVNYQVSMAENGDRVLTFGTYEFHLAQSSALSVSIKNRELTESSRYTEDSDQVAAIACPSARTLTINESGLGDLVTSELSDGFLRITTVITAGGTFSGAQLSQPSFIIGSEDRDSVSSIEYPIYDGFAYDVSLSSAETESDFCSFDGDVSGTVGGSDVVINLNCTTASVAAPICPLGGAATAITRFPTRTSGDGDGTLQLTFEGEGSPVSKDTNTQFTVSSSGALFLDNVSVSEMPYFCPASAQEILWIDSNSKVIYAMSIKADGSFNEFNLSTESDGFVGQYTDEAGDFSDLVYDLSTARKEGES